MSTRRQGLRPLSTAARAERDGVVVCPDVLVVVQGLPAGLGMVARDDLTAWFYGALERHMAEDLEGLAAAAQGGQLEPQVTVDLVLQAPGGVLRLDGCRLGLPVRHAGPASTLQYRVSHPGMAAEAPPAPTRAEAVVQLEETIDSVLDRLGGVLGVEEQPPAPPVVMAPVVLTPAPAPEPRLPILRRLRGQLRVVGSEGQEPPRRVA